MRIRTFKQVRVSQPCCLFHVSKWMAWLTWKRLRIIADLGYYFTPKFMHDKCRWFQAALRQKILMCILFNNSIQILKKWRWSKEECSVSIWSTTSGSVESKYLSYNTGKGWIKERKMNTIITWKRSVGGGLNKRSLFPKASMMATQIKPFQSQAGKLPSKTVEQDSCAKSFY